MAGIVFFTTKDLDDITKFYTEKLGCKPWLSQPNVEILYHGNLLIGFHQTDNLGDSALTSFVYESQEEVDEIYAILSQLNLTTSQPKRNETYQIYNFFAKDPEGRKLEFQAFLHDIPNRIFQSLR